jgi:hypothetical protein
VMAISGKQRVAINGFDSAEWVSETSQQTYFSFISVSSFTDTLMPKNKPKREDCDEYLSYRAIAETAA